jgi:hypothetical protein
MDREFYVRKIKQLTDDKLKKLLQLRNKENLEIMGLAEIEAFEGALTWGQLQRNQTKIMEKEQNQKRKKELASQVY